MTPHQPVSPVVTLPSRTRERHTLSPGRLPAFALLVLALASLACNLVGFGGPTNQRHNAVRRAALAHELSARGPADEVLVDFGFLEWRDNLGFSGGRTVWLNPVARDEFLAQRDPQRTYIYLHTPLDDGDNVHVEVERGGPDGGETRRLMLRPGDSGWEVVEEEVRP